MKSPDENISVLFFDPMPKHAVSPCGSRMCFERKTELDFVSKIPVWDLLLKNGRLLHD